MQMNITLTKEQTESIKQSLFPVLSSKDLANELFTKLSMSKDNSRESVELKVALISFISSKDKKMK